MSYFLVLLSGFLVACMEAFNGILSTHIGLYATSFVVHAIGIVLLVFYIRFILKEKISILHAPAYVYTCGILGMTLVVLTSFVVSQVGVVITNAFSLAGQLVLSIIMDHYGMFGVKQQSFDKKRIPCLCVIALGLVFVTLS